MATGNERIKGIQVHRPIIYGSMARLLTDEEKATAPPGHTHRWTIFLTSAATPPPTPAQGGTSSTDVVPVDIDYLPGGQDDLSYLFKRVVFRLHETYPNPNRVLEKPPYLVSETGWGEFTVQIKITFIPEASEKALTLQHPIKLHHWGEPIEAPPVEVATPAAATSVAAGTEAETVKSEVETPVDSTRDAAQTDAGTPVSAAPSATASVSAPAAGGDVSAVPAAISAAAAYPVHAWQYDEIVLSDPTANFLSILNEHPPTPLPAKSRRPRDQRAEHELKTGRKKARPSGIAASAPGSARPSVSRAGTEAPEGTGTGAGVTTRAGTPTVSTPAFIGLPGELGSADVPLEFTTEMEKSENARLVQMRVRIVDEMDRWREKLIAQEKELARLKEEMKG